MPPHRLLPSPKRDRGGCSRGHPQSDAFDADYHHGAEAFRANPLRSRLYSQVLRVSDAPCGRGVAGVAAGELHSGREVSQLLMASRLSDVEDGPSVELLATIASKSEKNIVRLYKAVYTHCDSILVAVYKDDAKVTAKVIMKMTQKLDPKRL
ncbi:uncharacterized protein [Blastocystis hominis]|uniref:Uncharacterized protein n=1 Tax=Blastocystis hominis TaxID=12968 RepID=D8LWM7_BLAHO|nr:uncharacterized protein [Blastocystis hominis]CBK20216.2 unnamed protein product [Blastocystis hominis]|eukprot:XP_012894264.1 uncharacterized protein [Blastocystis hominis]